MLFLTKLENKIKNVEVYRKNVYQEPLIKFVSNNFSGIM